MADAKVTALTAYTAPISTDVIPIVDVTTSTSKKVAISDLMGTLIDNASQASQSQSVVSATAYYITRSNLTMPTAFKVPMQVGTRFIWRVGMTKTAAGTGTFQVRIYRGINGTTADTADVTQTIGTQTAVVDNMMVDVQVVVTATGATGSYYWSICPANKAITATGFGVATGAGAFFSGTVSAVAMNTTSLQFGLGFIATTGTPTIVIPYVNALAFNIR